MVKAVREKPINLARWPARSLLPRQGRIRWRILFARKVQWIVMPLGVAMHKEWRPVEEVTPVDVYPSVAKRKKLRLVGRQTQGKTTKEIVVDGVLHELQNCLQSIGMGVDLLQLSQPEAPECRTINLGIERASRLLREMQEFFFPPEGYLSTRNLKDVLLEIARGVVGDSENAPIRFLVSESFPSFQCDWLALGRVFDRVLRCAYGLLLSTKGEIIISMSFHDGQPSTSMEVRVEIHGENDLGIEEERVFTPFWRVNDYQMGLGLVLARQAINRLHGQLTFEKTDACRAHFSVLLNIVPEGISLRRGEKEEGHGCME